MMKMDCVDYNILKKLIFDMSFLHEKSIKVEQGPNYDYLERKVMISFTDIVFLQKSLYS
jgi:hypothetical protein